MTTSEFVGSLFDQLSEWASKPDWLGSGFTRISMELAHLRGHPARRATSTYKAAIECWIAEQFKRQNVGDPKQLAQQIQVLLEGSMCLALIHGDISCIKSASLAAQNLVSE